MYLKLNFQCYELKTSQQELDRTKADLNALETKLKWSQNSLKTEIDLHKVSIEFVYVFVNLKLVCVQESQAKVELLSSKLQESADQVEKAKRDAEESIKAFHTSQDNKAFVLGKLQ